jgi:hypothetical protein
MVVTLLPVPAFFGGTMVGLELRSGGILANGRPKTNARVTRAGTLMWERVLVYVGSSKEMSKIKNFF